MPRFRFPLQSLLEYREHVERHRQLAVARVEIERRESEGRIGSIQNDIRSVKSDLRQRLSPMHPGQGTELREARLQATAALHLQLKAQREVIRLAGTHKRLDVVRAELTKAAVDRRAMERLREKRLEAWKIEQVRRENAAMDEIATQRAGRTNAFPRAANSAPSLPSDDLSSSPRSHSNT